MKICNMLVFGIFMILLGLMDNIAFATGIGIVGDQSILTTTHGSSYTFSVPSHCANLTVPSDSTYTITNPTGCPGPLVSSLPLNKTGLPTENGIVAPITVVLTSTETSHILPVTETVVITDVSTVLSWVTTTKTNGPEPMTLSYAVIISYSTEDVYTKTFLFPPSEIDITRTITTTSIYTPLAMPRHHGIVGPRGQLIWNNPNWNYTSSIATTVPALQESSSQATTSITSSTIQPELELRDITLELTLKAETVSQTVDAVSNKAPSVELSTLVEVYNVNTTGNTFNTSSIVGSNGTGRGYSSVSPTYTLPNVTITFAAETPVPTNSSATSATVTFTFGTPTMASATGDSSLGSASPSSSKESQASEVGSSMSPEIMAILVAAIAVALLF